MSSGGIFAVIFVAPVVASGSIALGAGWLAWQSGKFLLQLGAGVTEAVFEKKTELEEAEKRRKITAEATHKQLIDTCNEILQQIEQSNESSGLSENIKQEVFDIVNQPIPDSIEQFESLIALEYLKLDNIMQKQKRIAEIHVMKESTANAQSASEVLESLRIAIGAMKVSDISDYRLLVTDPEILERTQLNEQLTSVAGEIMQALDAVSSMVRQYGLTRTASAWYDSCFKGIDEQIQSLYQPEITNKKLKDGIARLHVSLDLYKDMAWEIEKETIEMAKLYEIYADTAKALGETVHDLKSFKNKKALETQMEFLKIRCRKAEECAKIYRQLGEEAYLCYAWDRELSALGYKVYEKKGIADIIGIQPERGVHNGKQIPFYKWSQSDLTQLYSLGTKCSLQVIVHNDGTVSMQTMADSKTEDVISTQKIHCDQLKTVIRRLKENWFISYDMKETAGADEVMTIAQWKSSSGSKWANSGDRATDRRSDKQTDQSQKVMQRTMR